MADKRQKTTGRKTSPTFAAKPHHIFRADCKYGIASPASVLSHMAAHLLDNLTAQFNGSNNGDLCAAPKIMKLYGLKIFNCLIMLKNLSLSKEKKHNKMKKEQLISKNS